MQHGSRKPHVSISSRMVAEPVFDHGNTIGCVGEPSEADRRKCWLLNDSLNGLLRVLSRWWEHSHLVLRNPLESSQAEDKALHLWSLILWSCLGAFEQTVIGLLRIVVAKERDPAVALPIQLYFVIALTCRRRVSLAVRRVFCFGFERFRRDSSGCFKPHWRRRGQTVRRGKFDDYQVTERQKTSSWQCCKGTCAAESSLTNQTCSQEARRRCATLLRADKSSVWGCGAHGPVATWQGRTRQEEPGRRQRCRRQRNRRNAPVVRRPVIARVNTRTSQLQ